MSRNFDLNIETVLEHWTVVHALREVIANALDEQALTETAEPEIFEDATGWWHIRDFGRGVRYEHLTQNENQEKLIHAERVVGKFGVGLKDALATFDRHGISVVITSCFGDITTAKRPKHEFVDLETLHAVISGPRDPSMVGTDVMLRGSALGADEIQKAKDLFLHYSGDDILADTEFGVVLRRCEDAARIYVNGLLVASEPSFLFSYNVTSVTQSLRRALNRERSNVGRSAYTDRVKAILLACNNEEVLQALADDLERFEEGSWHDETQWVDVGVHATRHLNTSGDVLFLTPNEMATSPAMLQRAVDDGHRPIVVPESLREKLAGLADLRGNPLRDLRQYETEWEDSFEFRYIDAAELSPSERSIWDRTSSIFDACGGRPTEIREICISETMRSMPGTQREAVGLWDEKSGRIIVKRSELSSLASFAGTVLHEMAHALSRAPDISLAFEDELTRQLGNVVKHGMIR